MKKWILLITISLTLACGQLITPEPALVAHTPTPTSAITTIPTATSRPTVTPKPATPAPTPTPTMTPTPIIYKVQSGDTLLGIAIAFDVSAEAIQTANGIVDPRRIQIGQALFIPEPETEGNAQPTATPTPVPVIVRGVSFQETPQGTLWCFGEMMNPGSVTLSELVVEVNLYDAQGNLLASEAAFTQLDILASNQSVPFAVLFEEPPSTFAQYQVRAISAVPILGKPRYYLELRPIETSANFIGESTYRVSGQLENIGEHNAEAIKLVVTAYDEANKVLAQRQASLNVVVLRSGARTPFALDITAPEEAVARYVVQAQALRAP